jgi:FMN-dependent NADH-azoreductase
MEYIINILSNNDDKFSTTNNIYKNFSSEIYEKHYLLEMYLHKLDMSSIPFFDNNKLTVKKTSEF